MLCLYDLAWIFTKNRKTAKMLISLIGQDRKNNKLILKLDFLLKFRITFLAPTNEIAYKTC